MNWNITLDKFYKGFSPLSFSNSLTELGSGGHASTMQNVDCLSDLLTQGPGLSNLVGGTQAGVVTELIQFIMDKAVANDVTYALGTTKLFQLSSTTVTSNATFPHTVTSMTEGESIQILKGNLYYFYNKASGGDIGKYDLSATFDDDWGSTVPTGFTALQNAPHPSGVVEDILGFGNGRYVGVYFNDSNTLIADKLDFGADNEVADILYNQGYWYIAVNSAISGTNRTEGRIFLWDGSGIPTTLADETGVGTQKIGFLHRFNGVVYVCYTDITSPGFIIGYINGKAITPLARYTGSLPNFQKKTLYKNTILALSDNLIYSAGSMVEELPFQLSQLASSTYSTAGALAAPFGTPLVSSTNGAGSFALAKFSGYTTSSSWKSIVFPLSQGKYKSAIDEIVVQTSTLGAGASCALTIEYDQASGTSTTQTIATTGKRRHYFKNFGLPSGGIEDMRISLSWSGGSATNACPIRRIQINGHTIEST